MSVVVETSARLHFGFQNLSLAHERLYGGVGVGLDEPRLRLRVSQAETLDCPESISGYAERVLEVLGVDGARITIEEGYDRHVGLGSGTQISLSVLSGVATAYGIDPAPRRRAPALGRGGRSGVGVGTFESGGFVVDIGHPTERFTTRPPGTGSWSVPQPLGRWTLPEQWRFLLVIPESEPGKSGDAEDQSIRSIVERADGSIADEIATLLTRRLLPAVIDGDLSAFGTAVSRLGRLNGAWFADEQGGVYRPPAGELIDRLDRSPAVVGTGQSSWGPTVYGVTDSSREEKARESATAALDAMGLSGRVVLTGASTDGATVRTTDG